MRSAVFVAMLLAAASAQTALDDASQWAQQLSTTAQQFACERLRVGGPLCPNHYGLQDIYDEADSGELQLAGAQYANVLATNTEAFFSKYGRLVQRIKAAATTIFRGHTTATEDITSLSPYYDTSDARALVPGRQPGRFFFAGQAGGIDTENSAFKTAPGSSKSEQAVKNSIGAGARLEPVFREIFADLEPRDWNKLYFGHASTGVWTVFPGFEWPRTSDGSYGTYDPRERPWYVAASSGPKDVILVIDTSGSMSIDNRLTLAKEAALAVLGTLSPTDYVNVIEFNSKAATPTCRGDSGSPFSTRLVRATTANVAKLRSFVDGLRPSGGTNYEEAIKLTYQLLETTNEGRHGSGCQSSILFLSDGDIAEGARGDDFLAIVDGLHADHSELNARIFSYTLGSEVDGSIPKAMACSTGGVYTHIPDGGNLRGSMASFYNLYAIGLPDRSQPLFSAPYQFATVDVLGMTTMLPVFDDDDDTFVGVAGVDLSLGDLLTDLANNRPTSDSYTFMVNSEGETIVHPRLRTDTGGDLRFEDIDALEGNDFAEAGIRTAMLRRQVGSATVETDRALPRGTGNEGVRVERQTVSYYWRPVNGTDFILCLVMPGAPVSGVHSYKQQGSPASACTDACQRNSSLCSSACYTPNQLYHRVDIVTGGVSRRPDSDPRFAGLHIWPDNSTFRLASSAFNSPALYLERDETVAEVEAMSEAATLGTFAVGGLPGDGVRNILAPTIIAELRKSSGLDPYWKEQQDETLLWRYVGTNTGTFRTYPGHLVTLGSNPLTYDPTIRPWFHRALSSKAQLAFSTPYTDSVVPRLVVTLSVAIAQGESGRTTLNALADSTSSAVMGVDWFYEGFVTLLEDNTAAITGTQGCNRGSSGNIVRCYIMDSAGYLVTHPDYRAGSPTGEWVGTLEPLLAQQLITTESNGVPFLQAQPAFVNYLTNSRDTYYVANAGVAPFRGTLMSGSSSLGITFAVEPVPRTNLFLIVLEGYPSTGVLSPASCPNALYCPDVIFPSSEQIVVDACEEVGMARSRVVDLTCPTISLTETKLDDTLRGEQRCNNAGADSLAVIIGVSAASGALLLVCLVYFLFCRNRGEGSMGKEPVGVTDVGVEMPPRYHE